MGVQTLVLGFQVQHAARKVKHDPRGAGKGHCFSKLGYETPVETSNPMFLGNVAHAMQRPIKLLSRATHLCVVKASANSMSESSV